MNSFSLVPADISGKTAYTSTQNVGWKCEICGAKIPAGDTIYGVIMTEDDDAPIKVAVKYHCDVCVNKRNA